jgi:hypothetical protein
MKTREQLKSSGFMKKKFFEEQYFVCNLIKKRNVLDKKRKGIHSSIRRKLLAGGQCHCGG